MGQPVGRREHLPPTLFVKRQPVVGPRPYAVAVHAHVVHTVIGQPLRRGEVLPPVPRHVLGRQPGSRKERANQNRVSHNVFMYSMRSINSSLVKSLLTPCVSFGLNTVQISSSVRAEPSCKYGAL